MRPLSGIRILDLTIVVAGPVGTSILGNLGAEVIKVENTVQRTLTRSTSSRAAGRGGNFIDLNRDKLGITLNLNVPQARDIFKRLVRISDVVIENFSPRVMRNFGLEHDDLVKVNPGIITVSMPAFGKTGPLRDMTSFGPGIDAMSGLSHLTGYPDSTPLKPGNYYCDYNAGVLAALAVMAAVFHKRRTGRGQAIEVAMRDGETQLVGEFILDYVLNGRVQQRAANRHPNVAPHNVYRCRGEDEWLAIAVETDAQWAALCRVMTRPQLSTDPLFATTLARKRNEDAVDRVVAEWAAGQDKIEAMHLLQAEGIPASAVMTTADIASDPHFLARGAFQEVRMPRGDTFRLQRAAWTARRADIRIGPGPEYSEHTEQVLRDLLGLSEDEIAALAEAGAIALPERAEERV
ncbi:MAG TPA: CoA transferase [Dehalococcoidia bacterium]|nr:CoA transferase [Dehalococcoidia bacterium]